jgi:two-component system CheB/CheR fusion protein
VKGRRIWELFRVPEEFEKVQAIFDRLRNGSSASDYESLWMTKSGDRRLISWSSTTLAGAHSEVTHIIATGIDITERKRLEEAVLDISAREQRRIAQDLHDDLGQHLTGVAFMARVLQDRLSETSPHESVEAAKIVALVNEAIRRTRDLARGLLPVVAEARGLMSALERLAGEVSDMFRISCRFEARDPVLIHEEALAEHLYHVAQEAVNNAIKHGRASSISIELAREADGILTVRDDGAGFHTMAGHRPGIGMQIMQYRAKMIGGSLDVRSTPGRGTVVRCMFPIRDRPARDQVGKEQHAG